jgi:hypothetical protein
MVDIDARIRLRTGMTPSGNVMAGGHDERAETHLALRHEILHK